MPTNGWMELAGHFMLQAVIEEYLLNGASGPEPFNTIFAFGCPGSGRRPDEGLDVQAMRTLFSVERNTREQLDIWTRTKQRYVNEVSVWSQVSTLPTRGKSCTHELTLNSCCLLPVDPHLSSAPSGMHSNAFLTLHLRPACLSS
jgi:hypothetical protein